MSRVWEYGGAYLRHNMAGEIHLPNDSVVKVADWTVDMPRFMQQADTLFIDPPWSKSNANSFYTKAGLPHGCLAFEKFSSLLMARITEIAPLHLFLEMGRQHLAMWQEMVRPAFPYQITYDSMYYRKPENRCYVIHAARSPIQRFDVISGRDEAEIIAWVCRHHEYQCIGDLCMGRGLVGLGAYRNGRRFVGTELNPKRLAVLVDAIAKLERRRKDA